MAFKTKHGHHYHLSASCPTIVGHEILSCSVGDGEPCSICCGAESLAAMLGGSPAAYAASGNPAVAVAMSMPGEMGHKEELLAVRDALKAGRNRVIGSDVSYGPGRHCSPHCSDREYAENITRGLRAAESPVERMSLLYSKVASMNEEAVAQTLADEPSAVAGIVRHIDRGYENLLGKYAEEGRDPKVYPEHFDEFIEEFSYKITRLGYAPFLTDDVIKRLGSDYAMAAATLSHRCREDDRRRGDSSLSLPQFRFRGSLQRRMARAEEMAERGRSQRKATPDTGMNPGDVVLATSATGGIPSTTSSPLPDHGVEEDDFDERIKDIMMFYPIEFTEEEVREAAKKVLYG